LAPVTVFSSAVEQKTEYCTEPTFRLAYRFNNKGEEKGASGINPVDTLWLGRYGWGAHLDYIYSNNRSDVLNIDSAICFSYQNITLAPSQKKEFIVRFTLARTEK
jgi:hypothetical protein